jgi:8-oxo-dGTP diphosphatase
VKGCKVKQGVEKQKYACLGPCRLFPKLLESIVLREIPKKIGENCVDFLRSGLGFASFLQFCRMKQPDIRLAVDAVVFGYTPERDLSILLIRRGYAPFAGSWALPGGFVLEHESLEAAVRRELSEETGIDLQYLEQLYTFGDTARDPRARVVSVAYFGLVKPGHFQLSATTDAADAEWFAVKDHPVLPFDHEDILRVALARLRAKATYEPIGFELLGDKFPFSHLEHLYSTLLGTPVERRNFRRKIMEYGFLEELNEKAPAKGSGRPGTYFRFNRARYFDLKRQGIYFDLATITSHLKKK